jgi:hypothetical protein|tara:strand:- start:2947 stop:3570 length:624 start_codon:yes stop_codon:yes gene_type:complete
MPDLLTSEDAAKVLRKNLENVVRKASEGKVLSRAEQDQLQGIIEAQGDGNQPKKIRSWTALAKELGITRKSVWQLRDKHNGPESYDLTSWKEFLERRANESPHWQNEDNQSEEVRKLRTDLLRAQAGKEDAIRKLRELEYAKAEAGLVPMQDAKAAIKRTLQPFRSLLDAYPKSIAVQANPTDPQLAEEAAREGMKKLFEIVQKELK